MSNDIEDMKGGCYCGGVRYRATLMSSEVTECHCSQCRKQSGHRHASVDAKSGDVEIDGAANITWFRASPDAERGFCSICGSLLFWMSSKDDEMAILAASFDEPSKIQMSRHIFVDDKASYYEITDTLPKFSGYDTPYPQE